MRSKFPAPKGVVKKLSIDNVWEVKLPLELLPTKDDYGNLIYTLPISFELLREYECVQFIKNHRFNTGDYLFKDSCFTILGKDSVDLVFCPNHYPMADGDRKRPDFRKVVGHLFLQGTAPKRFLKNPKRKKDNE